MMDAPDLTLADVLARDAQTKGDARCRTTPTRKSETDPPGMSQPAATSAGTSSLRSAAVVTWLTTVAVLPAAATTTDATNAGTPFVSNGLTDPLAQEAGDVHVAQPLDWYAANGIEPAIETADLCSDQGPWYCTDTAMLRASVSSVVVPRCDPKSCPETSIPAHLVPLYPASTLWGYPDNWRASSPVVGGVSAFGGWFGGEGSASASAEAKAYAEARAEAKVTVDVTEREEPEQPAPVPLPASWPLLAAALGGLALLRRRLT